MRRYALREDQWERIKRAGIPERFGDPIKLHTRFSRWAESGV
jgi:hypothetical protein